MATFLVLILKAIRVQIGTYCDLGFKSRVENWGIKDQSRGPILAQMTEGNGLD